MKLKSPDINLATLLENYKSMYDRDFIEYIIKNEDIKEDVIVLCSPALLLGKYF